MWQQWILQRYIAARDWIVLHGPAAVVARIVEVALAMCAAVIAVSALVLGIRALDAYLVDGKIPPMLRTVALTVTCVLLAFAAAVVLAVLIRMLRHGHATWRAAAVGVLGLLLLAFTIAVIRPQRIASALSRADLFRWGEAGEGVTAHRAIPTFVPPASSLSAEEASVREEAILEAYRFYLVELGPRGITEVYDRLRSYRPIVDAAMSGTAVDDPVRVEALMAVESGGDPRATSRSRARGLLQLIDRTARAYGIVNPESESYDSATNISAGTRYLSDLVHQYAGDWDTAYAAYNIGAGGFERAEELMQRLTGDAGRSGFWHTRPHLPTETRDHVPRVLAWEYIVRFVDAHGRLPPVNGEGTSAMLAARVERPRRSIGDALVAIWDRLVGPELLPILPTPSLPPSPPPTPVSDVWYVAQPGDRLGHVVRSVLREDGGLIAALNPTLPPSGSLASGTRVYIPQERFAFVTAAGETLGGLAARSRMTTVEFLRLNGVWSDHRVANADRDCPREGCTDAIRTATAEERFLVRR